jgi:arylsulfatase A-like enzyme
MTVTRPHVLLVVVDTVRADMAGLGAPGRSAMPALQAFARDAAVYPDASTTAPWTPPAHASLFTGAWVWRHGCDAGRHRLGSELPTLAERLAAAGYATGAVSANAWLGPGSGFDRGFQRFVKAWQLVEGGGDLAGVRRAGRASGRTDLAEAVRRARAGGLAATGANALHQLLWRRRGRLGGMRVARRTVALARELAAGGRPVFLFANLLDAHLPYRAPRRYRRAALGTSAGRARRVNQDPWAFVGGTAPMSEDDLGLLRGLYAAELAHVDDCVRRLLEGVGAALDLEDTLVVVASDHGEHLGEHGLMDHQYSLSETLLRVPLAVRRPGGEPAGVHPGLRQLVDVTPTILAAAGLPVTEQPGFGRPLERGPRPWALAEYLGPQPSMAAHARRGDATPFRRFDRALRALRLADGRKVVTGSDGSVALYDLARDPGELHDLAAERPSEALELADRLGRLSGGAESAPPNPPRAAVAGDDTDAGVRRALQSLGYLE